MEGGRSMILHKNVTRARQLELDILLLKEQEVDLKKKVEELENAVKPKKTSSRAE